MAEFMQECLPFSECPSRRFLLGRFRQVHNDTDVWTDIIPFAVNPLTLIFCHPCATLLSFAWVEIGIEYSQIRSVFIEHFISFYILMIDRDIFILFECDAVW